MISEERSNQQPSAQPGANPDKRGMAMRRLAALSRQGQASSDHIAMYAELLEVSERTIHRWLQAALEEDRFGPLQKPSFVFTPALLERLTYHRGSVASLYRELRTEPDMQLPSLVTVQRAARQQISPGDRAGMRKGERERRKYDVFWRRPPTHRNDAWEGDHVEAPVEVLVRGRLYKPWITWFIDTHTCAIAGSAVTVPKPSSESIMATLGAAISTQEPYGPIGGLPGRVRIDRGKDFLSDVVSESLRAFGVPVVKLPPYGSYLKGTVEGMNNIVEKMFFATLPRFTHRPTTLNGKPVDPDQPALPFEVFVEKFLDWTREWNTEHTMKELGGCTPAQAWLSDPTPVFEPPPEQLAHLTLKDDGRVRKISTKGVAWKNAEYVGAGLIGMVGTSVRLRHMPHHTDKIEVFDAATGRYLGPAYKSDAAPPEKVAEVIRVRRSRAARLRRQAVAAEKKRNTRFAAATKPGPPVALDSLTNAEADAELRRAETEDLRRHARPDYIPLSPPEEGWARPLPRTTDQERPEAL